MKKSLLIFFISIALSKQQIVAPPATNTISPNDPNSYSRPEFVRVTHINITWTVDFDRKLIAGEVILTFEKVNPSATTIVLDSKNLNILGIHSEHREILLYTKGDTHEVFGQSLTVNLPSEGNKIQITYLTEQNPSGLLFMARNTSRGGVPYTMFSQFQAIQARSVLPCQDSPSVKAPYSAKILLPMGYEVLMSAQKTYSIDNAGVMRHHFDQPRKVPPYLIAIIAGQYESRRIGNTNPPVHVWAEPYMIDRAAWEYQQIPSILNDAIQYLGPYVWENYDVVVLPYSFPYGGMENPSLTFLTPLNVAGDRSLIDTAMHEIAHSWAGNLVTCTNNEHLWLNEGLSTYLERKLVRKMRGKDQADLAARNGIARLKGGLENMAKENAMSKSKLILDLNNKDIESDIWDIPYEKGFAFACHIEDIMGGPEDDPNFLKFLRDFYQKNAEKSVDTDYFKASLISYAELQQINIESIEWDKWLKEEGFDFDVDKYFGNEYSQVCVQLIADIQGNFESSDETLNATINMQRENILFALLQMNTPIAIEKLERLGRVWNLRNTNVLLKMYWNQLRLRAGSEEAIDDAISIIDGLGHQWVLEELYKDMCKIPICHSAKAKVEATFERNKNIVMKFIREIIEKNVISTCCQPL